MSTGDNGMRFFIITIFSYIFICRTKNYNKYKSRLNEECYKVKCDEKARKEAIGVYNIPQTYSRLQINND